MKAAELLLNDVLPEDVQDDYTYDKKSMSKLTSRLAAKHPEKFQDIIQEVQNIGRNASYHSGQTLTLSDMKPVLDKDSILEKMDEELSKARILGKTKEDIEQRTLNIYQKYSDLFTEKTMKAALQKGNNLGNTVVSGARGKPDQLKGMLSTPSLYTDYKDNPIPLFVRNSFGEGLRPHEYLASTFGARKGVISTKSATAQAGDLGKLLSQIAAPLVVTEYDCGTTNGIDLSLDDDSLDHRVLASDTKGLSAGTILDRDSMQVLRKKNVGKVVARSPLTCEAKDGVCSKCLGADTYGKLQDIGYAAGVTSASAIAEPVAQAGLNTKHSGGVAGAKKKTFSGFGVISQIVQTPSSFPNEAAVASKEGLVENIEEASQGGKYVYIDGESHYVLPAFEVLVKPGEQVEAGQQLSEGIVDTANIVNLRGLGEGRRFYSERLKQALDDSGIDTNKKHTEVIAKAAINHIEIDDYEEDSNYLPGDVVNYSDFVNRYEPPEDTQSVNLENSVGKYLQQPALHYSIGTQITPSMKERLKESGHKEIKVADSKPNFQAKMIRLRNAPQVSDSWIQRMSTSYLKSNLTDSAIRGLTSNTANSKHYSDTLARGTQFGKNIEQTGKF